VPGGTIVIACSGNTIANASATPADSTYTVTAKLRADGGFDVVFTKGSLASEYIYTCRSGKAVGGPPEQH
jgi:hypothetical protein